MSCLSTNFFKKFALIVLALKLFFPTFAASCQDFMKYLYKTH